MTSLDRKGWMTPAKTQIATFTDQQFGENAYVVWCCDGGSCWIIDPGFPPATDHIRDHVKQNNLKPDALILTHGHLDHISGVTAIREMFKSIPVYIADTARVALTDPHENLSATFGFPVVVGEIDTIDLPAGGRLALDDTHWSILDTSGHSPGGRSLYCQEAGMVIVGDALFQGSIGRTDFHHSDHDLLIRNIKDKLLTLPEETCVYSGHGPVTTIGVEKVGNPFLKH